ncbi:MAG: ethanolamine ammonia-lyase subunit EutC [Oligoflexia bacterium]|nr:ethanolamine ammonia-lyase subunit EutC [Oligoflexia bacterium]
MLDQEYVREVVRQVLKEVIKTHALSNTQVSNKKSLTPAQKNLARWLGKDLDALQAEVTQKVVDKIAENPARLNVSRAGTRYLTRVALKFLSDHAVAKDAVYAELPDGFAEKNGWIMLNTKAKDKEEFLLRPDLGRQLNEASLQIVQSQGTHNCDVQITVADGLSPWATIRHSKALVDELLKLFSNQGLKVGKVFCVKYSRIAIGDVIGEALKAKVSMIILGERPGLGGGDSLSNYMVYNPKVGTVNALKSMISNIHPSGYTPIEAAKLTLYMVNKMFEQKCSGIDLKI